MADGGMPMQRMTCKAKGKSTYIVENRFIERETDGYTGEAVTRLAGFENFWEDILARLTDISYELEKLRADGKTHTVRFRELMVSKITNSNILDLLTVYGIS